MAQAAIEDLIVVMASPSGSRKRMLCSLLAWSFLGVGLAMRRARKVAMDPTIGLSRYG